MRFRFRRPRPRLELPPAPVNVRLADEDGRTAVALELVYTGTNPHGVALWFATAVVDAATTARFLAGELHITADEIPPRTAMTLALEEPE